MKTIHYLSFMYFCWGMASSMVFTLLPIFITEDLHSTISQFGLIEGIVIFCSFASKLCAGVLIDIFKRKINILYAGTIATVISKILLASAFCVWFVVIAKSIDRIAKGLRHAPIDAIFAELTSRKGFIYSYKYTINVLGSLVGSVITSLLVCHFGHQFRVIFILACIPTIIALYILYKKVKYQDEPYKAIRKEPEWNIKHIKYLSSEYWHFLILVSLIMLNRFSEGFITLKAKAVLPNSLSDFPLYMGIYELCIVLIAIPMGMLSDKVNKYKVILIGLIAVFLADLFGIFANNTIGIVMIYILCGIHMGSTHSILTSIIAKTAPKELIGTAFALYYGIDGIVLFTANNLAGSIGKLFNNWLDIPITSGPFIMGLFTTTIAILYTINLIWAKDNLLQSK